MNATTQKTDHRSLPRTKREPSERDQAIYTARHSLGWTQARLAKKYHISQRRISAILKRVERWRGNARPEEQGELEPDARLRLERRLEHERARAVYDKAMRAFDAAPKVLKTTKKGQRGDVEYHEEVTREQPPNVQLLRTALQANADLAKVADKPAPPKQLTPQEDEERRRRDALNWLYEQRFKAESHYRVPKSNDGSGAGFGEMDTVDMWLDALLGTRESSYLDPEFARLPPEQFEPGRALSHLANYLPRALAEQNAPGPDESVPSRDQTWSRSEQDGAVSDSAVGSALRGAADSADGTPTGGTPGAGLLPAKRDASNGSNAAAEDSPQDEAAEGVEAESEIQKAPHSHAQRGNASPDAPRPKAADDAERRATGSHAERGNQKPLPVKNKKRPWQEELTREAVATEFAHLEMEPAAKDRFVRKVLTERKLAKFNELRRRGLPFMMEFDPEDGPVPPTHYQLDDYGWRG